VSDQWFRFFNNIYTIVGSNQGVLQIINGGTGLDTLPANGQLLIGDVANGYVLNTLTPVSGIGITNAPGAITVANTGVLSNIAGLGVSVSGATGNVTIANTGVLSNIAGSGVSVSGATGNVTIANTGVLSFSAGTTGLTPSTATTGAVTLAGTLAVANGGTGGTTAATARTNLGVTATGADTTYAFRANNLSDLASAATARTNLGVTATGADTTYAFRANNLSDLASAATARTNLGLGTMAVKNIGVSGTFTTADSKTVTVTDGIITSIV
jgi:hypothetical protein